MTSPTPKAVIPKASFSQKKATFPQNIENLKQFGHSDESGHAFVIVDGTHYPVGQYALPGGQNAQESALKYFGRKFDGLASQVTLLEQRVGTKKYLPSMTKEVQDLQERSKIYEGIGDYIGLQKRIELLTDKVAALEKKHQEQLRLARENEIARREALVQHAEETAAKDPESIHWKNDATTLQSIFERWQDAQKNGMRLGKDIDDAMWNRMRSARSQFDVKRRAFFSELEANNKAGKLAKEALTEKAENLSDSRQWDKTAKEFKNLMNQWRQTPRAGKKDDERLWERFHAAQTKFFSALKVFNEQINAEHTKNLKQKEGLLKEAQALVPLKNVSKARQKLRLIQQKWEEVGRLPPAETDRMEHELDAVQKAIERAEERQWKATDPVLAERTRSILSQLQDSIAELQKKLADAQADNNVEAAQQAQEALATRQAWLENLKKNS